MTGPLLDVRGLGAGYGDLQVLWDVSLAVQPGRATVVLGRNGAGKTTLLSALAGLVRTSAGSVHFLGTDITGAAAPARTRSGIGLVQENKRIFRRRTVEQNLQLGGYTLPRREVGAAIEPAYARFPVLKQRRRDPAGALSGGQQQMLAIAQALMPGPKLLMLDEPSAGLAPVVVQEVLETVRGLKAAGLGILLVEQLVDQALSVADVIVVIEHGRAVSSTTAERGMNLAALRDAYLGREHAPASQDGDP
jgi:branched-chain amino acid transport system ATP-binding protein